MTELSPFKKLHSIQMIAALVRRWWQLELAFADKTGYVIDHAEGKIYPPGNEFCRISLFSKEGFKRCNESVKVVKGRLQTARSRPVYVHQCHLGFDVVAAPLHFDGELAGFLFTGGSYGPSQSPVPKAELLRKVREFDEVDADLESAHESVPRLGERELSFLADLLAYGAEQVVTHWHQTIRPLDTARAGDETQKRFEEIVGGSPAMEEVFDLLDKIVPSEATVLIHGESGTGKELIAKAIHSYGPRAKKPFVVQNCSAFNDNLLETALFGHMRGAFTGAVKDQKGLFEVADGGTFFLDEIGDMSPALQVKLLRVLQEGTFTPVGSTKPVTVDVRIVAASHKDLAQMVETGQFREDLYYRINVLKITAPPLRERIEDLPLLISFFARKHRGDAAVRFSSTALSAMRRYSWPGNVRELENEIERVIILAGDATEIGIDLLSPRIRKAQPSASAPAAASAGQAVADKGGTLREVVETIESEVIAQGLIRTHWNKSQLAKELGISRSNLIQKCSYYGLERKSS